MYSSIALTTIVFRFMDYSSTIRVVIIYLNMKCNIFMANYIKSIVTYGLWVGYRQILTLSAMWTITCSLVAH